MFGHVYMDVGLAINHTGAASDRIIAESLELAPFRKVLFSSDAWGLPELHLLGSWLFRRGLARGAGRLGRVRRLVAAGRAAGHRGHRRAATPAVSTGSASLGAQPDGTRSRYRFGTTSIADGGSHAAERAVG